MTIEICNKDALDRTTFQYQVRHRQSAKYKVIKGKDFIMCIFRHDMTFNELFVQLVVSLMMKLFSAFTSNSCTVLSVSQFLQDSLVASSYLNAHSCYRCRCCCLIWVRGKAWTLAVAVLTSVWGQIFKCWQSVSSSILSSRKNRTVVHGL